MQNIVHILCGKEEIWQWFCEKVGAANPIISLDLPDIIVESGPSYGPWLSAGAILVSALIAARMAFLGLREQRKIAKKRATLDMLSRREWDADYLSARTEFNRLKTGPTPLETWVNDEHKNTTQSDCIRTVLNDYELIAVGIREDILDEELYKVWFKTSFLRDYNLSKSYIAAMRKKYSSDQIFAELQNLAESWDDQVRLPLEKDEQKQ
ncbi:MAG: DUF4760 domain-containing protein [Pseudomonadota bacterium]